MTKAELIAATAAAPDDMEIFITRPDSLVTTTIAVTIEAGGSPDAGIYLDPTDDPADYEGQDEDDAA